MSRRIEMLIDLSGNAQIKTEGFAGPVCRQVSAFLEQSLGSVTSERTTAEFFARSQCTVNQGVTKSQEIRHEIE